MSGFTAPEWRPGMTWKFRSESGESVVTQVLGVQNLTSPYHGAQVPVWNLRTTTYSNGTLTVALIQLEKNFLRTLLQQVDVYTPAGDAYRIVRLFNPPVPIPWWMNMAPVSDADGGCTIENPKCDRVRYLTQVRIERVVNGQVLPPDDSNWTYHGIVNHNKTTRTVPYGDVTGWMVASAAHPWPNPNPFAPINATWYLYVPEIEYYAAAYPNSFEAVPSLVLVDAILSIPPRLHVVVDPPVPYAGADVVFDASASTDPDGEITLFEWGLPDGSHRTGPVLTMNWAQPGRYPVVLTGYDDQRASTTETLWVNVIDRPLELKILAREAAYPERPLNFRVASPDRLVRATWDFGDGTPGASGLDVTHAFLESGEYTVTVNVVGSTGNTAQATHRIRIIEPGTPLPPGAEGTAAGVEQGSGGSRDAPVSQTGGPHIISPGNGSLVPSATQSFLLHLGDVDAAELKVGDAAPIAVAGPGVVLVSAPVPRDQGLVAVTLQSGSLVFDRVVLVPTTPRADDPGDDAPPRSPRSGTPGAGALGAIAALAAAGVVVAARRRPL